MKKLSFFILFLLFSFSLLAQSYTKGSKVEILWGGRWYKGEVIEVDGEKFKVHYDGYSASWDEWVTKEKLRTVNSVNAGQTTSNNEQKNASAPKPAEQKASVGNQASTQVVKQTYQGTSGKLYLRTYYWVGMYGGNLDISWLFLGADGTIVRDPKNGVDPINYKAEAVNNPNNIGKYMVVGKKFLITWQNGKKEEWSFDLKNGEYSTINGGIVSRQKGLPANYRISGQFAAATFLPNVSSVHTLVFKKDGTFTLNKSGAVYTGDVSAIKQSDSKGTYVIKGNTLHLNFENGEKQVSVITVWEMDKGKLHLVINKSSYPQEK